MSLVRFVFAVVVAASVAAAAHAGPVLLISIDGLRPGDVLDGEAHGIKTPNLHRLMAEGAYARSVRNVLPTVTYPNHTTLITGVTPAVHGIAANTTFDPFLKNQLGWYWYAADIKVPTLWDAVHQAGGEVANIGWPVSVGARAIDDNIPEYWRARTDDDAKLVEALSSPGLVAALEKSAGATLIDLQTEGLKSDEAKTKFALALIQAHKPKFFTLHISSLDHIEHISGPGSPEAKVDLEALDALLGALIDGARAAQPDLTVAVVSDHGFAPVHTDVNLIRAFIGAGLARVDLFKRTVVSWEAEPWPSSGSVAVVLARPDDEKLKARVRGFLNGLASDADNGIERIIEGDEIAARGGAKQASFYIDFKIGYEMGYKPDAPMISPSASKGMHGYFPDHPEMRAALFIAGPETPKADALGEIDMIDIAPTLAKVLGVALPRAQGKALF